MTIPNQPAAPAYTHDGCPDCTYLGHHAGQDLYFCPQGDFPTVLARESSDSSDYISGLALADQVPGLREARRRAIERGLLPALVTS